MNRLFLECQLMCSRMDGTFSDLGYENGDIYPLGTGIVSVFYDARIEAWHACASWGYGSVISTPGTDYPKDALKCLKRYLKKIQREGGRADVRRFHKSKKRGKRG